MSNVDGPEPGVQIQRTGGSDGVLSDLMWRARMALNTYGTRGERVCPDGDWTLQENKITRKVWDGYDCRVVLETELKPGQGWRAYIEASDGSYQPLSLIREVGLFTEDGPDLAVKVGHADSVDGIPHFPRREAFRTAELFMSEYAMKGADRGTPGDGGE